MKKLLLLFLLTMLLPFSANAQAGKSPFCDSVNAKRESCKLVKVDCSMMMGDLDAVTLDTIDKIKSCPPYQATEPATPDQTTPDLGNLVCCLGSAR